MSSTYHTTVAGRPLRAEAASGLGAARLIARELYGNGMSVVPDDLFSDTFHLVHPFPRPWRPVVSVLRLVKESAPP